MAEGVQLYGGAPCPPGWSGVSLDGAQGITRLSDCSVYAGLPGGPTPAAAKIIGTLVNAALATVAGPAGALATAFYQSEVQKDAEDARAKLGGKLKVERLKGVGAKAAPSQLVAGGAPCATCEGVAARLASGLAVLADRRLIAGAALVSAFVALSHFSRKAA